MSYFLYAQEIKCIDVRDYTTIESLQTFEDDLKTHPLVLVGEAPHNMPANTYLQTELITHLNSKYGTRFLIIKWGLAEAYLLNKYLETGNDKYYNKTFNGYLNFVEAREAIEKLYQYNKTVPKSSSITFVGVDFERDPALTSSIYYFLSDFNDPTLNPLTEKVKARFDTINFEMEPTPFLEYLRTELPKYSHILDKSKDWDIIKEIIYNKSNHKEFNLRDQRMVEQFLKQPQNERYLGFFGTGHTQLDYKKAFATMLIDNNLFTRTDILTINIHHENSYSLPEYPIERAFLNDNGFFKRKAIKKVP